MSIRKQLRHALKDLLLRVEMLNNKVFVSRAVPVIGEHDDQKYDVPCVLVYTDRDPASDLDGYRVKRELVVRVVAIVRAEDGADDKLDDICEAIESVIQLAFDKDPALGVVQLVDIAEDCRYVDTELTYTGADGRADLVNAIMSFTITYVQSQEMTLPQLKTVAIDIDMSNPRNYPSEPHKPDGQIDAQVRVDFPE